MKRRYTVGVDLAWAAGFFDGEGTTCYTVRPYREGHGVCRSIAASCAQVEREPLERFVVAVGMGRIVGPYKPRNPNGQPYYDCRVHGGERVRELFAKLGPYLCRPKRDQMQNALAAWDAYILRPVQCEHGQDKQRCATCRSAWARRGWEHRERPQNHRACDEEGCNGDHYARGKCAAHYQRWLRGKKAGNAAQVFGGY